MLPEVFAASRSAGVGSIHDGAAATFVLYVPSTGASGAAGLTRAHAAGRPFAGVEEAACVGVRLLRGDG